MTLLRSSPLAASLLALGIASALLPSGPAGAQNATASTAEQRKELDAARADLERAAKHLAELTGRYGAHGMPFDGLSMAKRPVIGVLLAPDPQGGVRIAGVTPDGPAAGAGLKTGDRLLRIGGKPIAGDTPEARVDAARALLQAGDDKTPVKLVYARDGRDREVAVTPRLGPQVMLFAGDGRMMRPGGNVMIRRIGGDGHDGPPGDFDFDFDIDGPPGMRGDDNAFAFAIGPDGAHRAETRVIRIECKDQDEDCRKQAAELEARGPGDGKDRRIVIRTDCAPGADCRQHLRLAEAFRWNGLNLASVDAQLGRYFGTDKGVLVLSTGPALGELQAGDVIQRVDGQAVDTPRAVMDALRDKPADSTVPVDYLRDRKPGTTRVTVPKPMTFPLPPPSRADGGAPGPSMTRRSIVMVDRDGQVQRWEDNGEGPMPMPPLPPPPPMPPED